MAVAPTAPLSKRQIKRREMGKNVNVGGEVTIMAMGRTTKATLGELIATVTDEVTRLTRGSGNTNILVSQIVRHLFATRRVRLKRRGVLKLA